MLIIGYGYGNEDFSPNEALILVGALKVNVPIKGIEGALEILYIKGGEGACN